MDLSERLEQRLSLEIRETEAALKEADRAAEKYYSRSPGHRQYLQGQYSAYIRAREIIREEAQRQ